MRPLFVAFVSLILAFTGLAQETTSAVPNLVRYSGTISTAGPSSAGQTASPRTVGVTFAL